VFAKIFGQIFDSSIAEDYNCRRMFMDLLVLADETGAVDMTHEAIARRTNVPLEDVKKYITQLCLPDPKSRSKVEEGKRLKLLNENRDWGWQVINYRHYRSLRDKEMMRSYFRDSMRKSRAMKRKHESVKDTGLTGLTTFNDLSQSLTSASASSSSLSVLVQEPFRNWIQFRLGFGRKPKNWKAMFEKQIEWLKQYPDADQVEILNQSIRNGWQGLFPPKRDKNSIQGRPGAEKQESRVDRQYRECLERRAREKQEAA